MADQTHNEENEPKGVKAPSSKNKKVDAPPLDGPPKPPPSLGSGPGGRASVTVDETGCYDVVPPHDPTFKGARY